MRRKSSIVAALFVSLLIVTAVQSSPASAYTTTGCKWSSTEIKWTNEVGGDYGTQAGLAASSWSSTTDVNLSSPGGSLMVFTNNQGQNGYDGWSDWSCWPVTHYMIGANVTLNPYYTDAYSSLKKRAVWTHELGHGLGLNHSAYDWAIMFHCAGCVYDTYGYYAPRSDDQLGINAIY